MVVFEESHGETWTVRKEMALRISATRPENYYYGHLVDLLRDELNVGSMAMVDWSEETLGSAHALVIAHPASQDVEPNVGGSPIFSTEEINQIEEFVRNGGGLFVIGEYGTSSWGSNINALLERFGIEFNDDALALPRPDMDAVMTRHFPIMVRQNHSITSDLFEITYHRGCSISLSRDGRTPPEPAICLGGGACVCACAELGAGRIVAIGDSDLFSLPYIGHSDNVRLFINIVRWLLKRPMEPIDKRDVIILKRPSEVRNFVRGHDLKRISGNHIHGATIAVEAFEKVADGLPNPYHRREEFLSECEFRFHSLPEPLRRAVISFKRHGNPYGALHLSGLPIDRELPPTPGSMRPPSEKKTFWSETWLGMIGQALGDPIGYSVHHDGQIFQNVCPIRGEESEQSAGSSRVFLEWHTEQAFHPILPDFVVLLCLRSDPELLAKTAVASVANVLAHIPVAFRQILFQPRFRAGVDFSFGATESGQRRGGPLVPLLYGQAYDPFMKFDLEQMEPTDREAAFAFDTVKRAVKEVYNYVKLRPGDALIIDNRRAIHARSVFTPRYTDDDRWLQRIYVRRDIVLTNEERYRSERIIDTAFSMVD